MRTMNVQPPAAPPDLRPHLEGANTAWTLMQAIVEKPKETKAFLQEWRKITASYDKFSEAMQKHAAVAKIAELQMAAEEALADAKTKQAEAAEQIEIAKADAADIRKQAKQRAKHAEAALADKQQEVARLEAEAQQALDAQQANEAAARNHNEAAAKAREAAEKDRAEAAAYLTKVKGAISVMEAAA